MVSDVTVPPAGVHVTSPAAGVLLTQSTAAAVIATVSFHTVTPPACWVTVRLFVSPTAAVKVGAAAVPAIVAARALLPPAAPSNPSVSAMIRLRRTPRFVRVHRSDIDPPSVVTDGPGPAL